MPPKKAKAQKMALAEFFADTTSGSWADDMDLPTAPAAKDPSAGPRRGEPGYLDSMPDRASRGNFPGAPQGREELPLPTAPPYTAYIGNLTFETSDDELREHFGDLHPSAVRLVKDDTGRSKGFGYVEFPDVEALKAALERSNSQLGGRTIRVSVASAPSGPRREPSAAEESNQWRRTGPLPVREPPASARRGPSYTGAPGGEDRDWGAARGAKFTPAPPSPLGPMRRDSSGQGRERSMEPSAADEVSQWRSSKPMVEISHESGQSSPSLAETETTWSRGTKLRTPVTDAPNRSSNNSPDEREWRGSRGASAAPSQPSRQGSADLDSPATAAPVERRKLNLAPRSVPATPSTGSPETATATPPTGRSSIFGGAKPVDSATREKEAEEKMAARAAERRAEAQKAKEEEEKKIKELAEERQRSIKEAQEKARAEFGGAPAPEANGAGHGGSVRGGRGGMRGANGPARGGRGGPMRTPSGGAGPRSPTSPRAKHSTPGEDGFEGVRGHGARMAPPVPKSSPPVQEKKKEPAKTTRQGFSFAAAMKAGGFDEGDDDEEEEGANGEDKEVEEVRKGVEGIAA